MKELLSQCPFVPGQKSFACPAVPKSCTVPSRWKPYLKPKNKWKIWGVLKKQLSLVIPFVKVTEIHSIIFFSSFTRKRDTRIVPNALSFYRSQNVPKEALNTRPVVPGFAGCAMAHPDFDRSVNPISTRGDRLCPPNYYWHTQIFRPSDGPDMLTVIWTEIDFFMIFATLTYVIT